MTVTELIEKHVGLSGMDYETPIHTRRNRLRQFTIEFLEMVYPSGSDDRDVSQNFDKALEELRK